MQYIDDAEFQIAIDLDNGARISSITWRDLQFTIPYRGSPLYSGWYSMGPWAGRVRDGIIRGADGEEFQLLVVENDDDVARRLFDPALPRRGSSRVRLAKMGETIGVVASIESFCHRNCGTVVDDDDIERFVPDRLGTEVVE